MQLPADYHFEARLPGVAVPIRIASMHDAQVFTRRWVIRDKDRDLKALLRKMDKANSSEASYLAIRDFKAALVARGLLGDVVTQPTS